MTPDQHETISVHSEIPLPEYAFLYRLAESHHVTVGALVAELVHRGLSNAPVNSAPPPKTGRATGGPKRKLDTAEINRLRELHAARMSDPAIARQLGIAVSTVQKYRTEMRLKAVGKRGRPANTTKRRNAA